MVDPTDPVSRPVAYKPARATEDPRLMFTGPSEGHENIFDSLRSIQREVGVVTVVLRTIGIV